MISYSLQQSLAYGILTLLVLCITFCILNVLYNLLVYLVRTTERRDEMIHITNSFL